MKINNIEIRSKIRCIFESYLYYSLFELLTGVKAHTYLRQHFVSFQ